MHHLGNCRSWSRSFKYHKNNGSMSSCHETPSKLTWSRMSFQKMISQHWIKSGFLLTVFSTDFNVRYLLEPGTYFDIFPENLELSYYPKDGKCSSQTEPVSIKRNTKLCIISSFCIFCIWYSEVFLLVFLLVFCCCCFNF